MLGEEALKRLCIPAAVAALLHITVKLRINLGLAGSHGVRVHIITVDKERAYAGNGQICRRRTEHAEQSRQQQLGAQRVEQRLFRFSQPGIPCPRPSG